MTHDLVVCADGVNSAARADHAATFRPTLDVRRCKFMWLGTDLVFDAFKFYIVETPHGVMQIHGYPYDATGSTFIVEMNDEVWTRAGFAAFASRTFAPGESDLESIAEIRRLFEHILGAHAVHANNSKWISFTTVRNESWHDGNVVILGDAAHTAHFSIGSGTKLAMEDALALAACVHEQHTIAQALDAYEAERKPVVVSTQRAAQASLEWFENLGQYVHQDPLQFAFNILTRSRRVTYDNLRLRDPEFVHRVDAWFASQLEVQHQRSPDIATPPMFQPFRLRDLELKNRVIVSAMDMYSADDGMPNDFHLVQTGGKALGGAGLVMTEMVCVSAAGRITPGCTGMYAPEHENGWRRIVDFVHERSTARIGLQLGHSGRKGSTRLMWEGMDEPLPDGNWEIVAPSPIAYTAANQIPRELTRDEMDEIREQFVRAAEAGVRVALRARIPALELHLTDLEPANGRVRWSPGAPSALSARGVRRHSRGVAGAQADHRANLRDRLVPGRQRCPGRGRNRARVLGARRRRNRCVDRSGDEGRAARLRALVSDAVLGPDPQRGWDCDDRRRRHLVV
jgi:anthraniloyl-CoA monooxygenase